MYPLFGTFGLWISKIIGFKCCFVYDIPPVCVWKVLRMFRMKSYSIPLDVDGVAFVNFLWGFKCMYWGVRKKASVFILKKLQIYRRTNDGIRGFLLVFLTEVSNGIAVHRCFHRHWSVTLFPAFWSPAKIWYVAISVAESVARYSSTSENPTTLFRR